MVIYCDFKYLNAEKKFDGKRQKELNQLKFLNPLPSSKQSNHSQIKSDICSELKK